MDGEGRNRERGEWVQRLCTSLVTVADACGPACYKTLRHEVISKVWTSGLIGRACKYGKDYALYVPRFLLTLSGAGVWGPAKCGHS